MCTMSSSIHQEYPLTLGLFQEQLVRTNAAKRGKHSGTYDLKDAIVNKVLRCHENLNTARQVAGWL